MMRNIVLNFSKLIRMAGYALGRLSQLLDRVDSSRLIEKGDDRNLYKTKYDDLFWLDEKGYVDQCIIKSGIFEEKSTQATKQLIKKDHIVLDVGANIGYYSVLFSRLVGQKGRVLCFEPTKYYGKVLKMNLEANNVDNVEVFEFGLSDKSQQLEIQIGGSSASLHNPGNIPSGTNELIKLTTLDDFMEEHRLQKIDFIKVDIDGHEPLFFKGAWKTLDKYDPIILLEVSHLHYYEAGFTAWDFFDTLKNKGYRIYHEDDLAEITTKEDFLIKCGNFAYSSNILISKKELKVE